MAGTPHADDETERNRNKEMNHARSCLVRTARCALRGTRGSENRQTDGRRHQNLVRVRVRVRFVAVSWHSADCSTHADGHEYCGIVEEVGRAVKSIKPGQFVIGSFFASDNTCPNCHIGYQSSCQHRELVGGAQAPVLRVPLADGTLVATPDIPSEDLIPSLLTLSDVMGTGWFAADAANVKPGSTVAVVGDGAVGLLGVLSAKQMGAERIVAMSRHESRQKLAREFGATDIVTDRGEKGVSRIKELTHGIGADSVLECVGTQESMMQAINSSRKGGYVSYVGVPHGVELNGEQLFFAHVHLHGGPAPVRRYLPEMIQLVWNRKINPGKVFDLTLPLEKVAEGYRAMDERRAIKTLLRP